MIGDSLFDCGESLDHYLANYEWPDVVAQRVRKLREDIRSVQEWLDGSQAETLANVKVSPVRQWLARGAKYPPRHSQEHRM